MDESFQLPNEVSYSSQKYAGKVADREGMATKEYKADGTTRIKPVEIENNNIPPVTVDTKKHAQQATSLGRLKLVCVCLVISTVINAATFGGLIYDTRKQIETNERKSESFHSDVNKLLKTSPLIPQSDPKSDIEARLLNLETGQTHDRFEFQEIGRKVGNLELDSEIHKSDIKDNYKRLTIAEAKLLQLEPNATTDLAELKDITHRLSVLETYQTQDRDEFIELRQVTSNLDFEINTFKSDALNNSYQVSSIENDILQLQTKQAQNRVELHELNNIVLTNSSMISKVNTSLEAEIRAFQNLSSIVNELNISPSMDCVSAQNFTAEIANINAKIDRERSMNEEHESSLSKLESDWSFVTALVQDHTSRITQVEADRVMDHSTMLTHASKIAQLEVNLTAAISVTKANSDGILANSNSLMWLTASITTQNDTVLIINERLAQLETDGADVQNTLLYQESSIRQVDINLLMHNSTLENHSLKLEELELKRIIGQDMISNNTIRLLQLEIYSNELNASSQMETSVNQVQNQRLEQLEIVANITRASLGNHDIKLTKLTDNKSAFSIFNYSPSNGDHGNIVFRHAHTNIGGHYSETTGRFTCQYAGIYIFSLNIYKKENTGTQVTCRIRHNGNALVYAYVPATTGYHEGSGSVIVHLSIGDIVDIGQCSHISKIDAWTSLYGFLIYAD